MRLHQHLRRNRFRAVVVFALRTVPHPIAIAIRPAEVSTARAQIVDFLGRKIVAQPVTAVVGGLIATASDPCGVVFCGTVARSPQVWLELSTQTFAAYPDYPFMLWIDIAQFQAGPQIFGALTCGLSRFIGREIEFETPGPSASLIQRVAGLAGSIIEHGDQVDAGDTIGNSDGERIEVRHGVSRFSGAPVLRAGPEGTLIGTGETMSAQHIDHRSLQRGDA